jgi:NAD(P)-dependent dehydrogenase (short-subunit alcohol dehydrogenase family)
MELGLRDKVVIVTGGGAGIGRAISQTLADEGAIPVILDRRPPDPEVLEALSPLSPALGWVQLDLSDDKQCEAAVLETKRRWGRIDALVNNAGVNDRLGLDAGPAAFRALPRRKPRPLLHAHAFGCVGAEGKPRGGRQHLLEDGAHGSRRYVSLCSGQGRAVGTYARVGGGPCGLRRAGQRSGTGGGHDPAIFQMARGLCRSGGETCGNPATNPPRATNDRCTGDRRHCGLFAFRAREPHDRAMAVRRWRLHAS